MAILLELVDELRSKKTILKTAILVFSCKGLRNPILKS